MEPSISASTKTDEQAVARMLAHHAEMNGALAVKVDLLVTSARAGSHNAADESRLALVHWCRHVLLPHAEAQEATLYRVAAQLTQGRLLIEALLMEHRLMGDVVDQLEEREDAVGAAPMAAALQMLVESHLAKENNQVLPMLVDEPSISVSALCEELYLAADEAGRAPDPADDGYGHPVHEPTSCRCSEIDVSGFPELDARLVPHAIRHATVFEALEEVAPESALVLVAPHDPIPLLRQLDRRQPGSFTIEYLQRGPETWRLLLTRTTR